MILYYNIIFPIIHEEEEWDSQSPSVEFGYNMLKL